MTIFDYKNLIGQLPYFENGYEIMRSTWKNSEEEFQDLFRFNDNIFGTKDVITINRTDLFETSFENPKDFILKTLYWSFPKGMKGLNFQRIIHRLNAITSDLQALNQNFSIEDGLKRLCKYQSLGAKGITSLLYFTGLKSDFGIRPLILNPEIIQVLNRGQFEEFRDYKDINTENWDDYYAAFIQTCHNVAQQAHVKPDQIEFFLQTFGAQLTPVNTEIKVALAG